MVTCAGARAPHHDAGAQVINQVNIGHDVVKLDAGVFTSVKHAVLNGSRAPHRSRGLKVSLVAAALPWCGRFADVLLWACRCWPDFTS